MKKVLLINLWFGVLFIATAQQLPNLPILVGAADAEVWNNGIYHFGGSDNWSGTTIYNQIYKFDGTNWMLEGTIPDNNLWDVGTVLVGNFVYLLDGYPSGAGLNRRYNLILRNWEYLANSPNISYSYGLTSEEVNGIIYLFNLNGDVYAYNIATNTWTTKTPNSADVIDNLNSVKFQDEIYIAGWDNGNFYKYTPSSDQWTQLASLPYSVGACGMGRVNNLIYCIGGNDFGGSGAVYSSIVVYNVATNSWTIDPLELSSKRHWMATAEYMGGLYVLGGIDELATSVDIVEQIVPQGTAGIDDTQAVPQEYSLAQNFPNPFNPATTIKYLVPQLSDVLLKIFDVLGNEVAVLVDEEQPSGFYKVEFNASQLSSGVYFYTLRAGDYFQTKKMILTK